MKTWKKKKKVLQNVYAFYKQFPKVKLKSALLNSRDLKGDFRAQVFETCECNSDLLGDRISITSSPNHHYEKDIQNILLGVDIKHSKSFLYRVPQAHNGQS